MIWRKYEEYKYQGTCYSEEIKKLFARLKLFYLPPANEVWSKVMFLHLCVILFREGVCLQGGLHPGGLGKSPPSDTTGYGPRVGGTHPTGMHSCLANFQNAARRRHVHTSRKPMGKRKRSRNNRKRSKKKFRTSKKIFAFAFWFRSV